MTELKSRLLEQQSLIKDSISRVSRQIQQRQRQEEEEREERERQRRQAEADPSEANMESSQFSLYPSVWRRRTKTCGFCPSRSSAVYQSADGQTPFFFPCAVPPDEEEEEDDDGGGSGAATPTTTAQSRPGFLRVCPMCEAYFPDDVSQVGSSLGILATVIGANFGAS